MRLLYWIPAGPYSQEYQVQKSCGLIRLGQKEQSLEVLLQDLMTARHILV